MYRALYREYRPMTFSQVAGQEHITGILKSQIKSGRVGHAYLFCGPRGTGKTSCAKIFARAINCSAGDGEPCGGCAACQAALTSMDIVELDAASNNGVDNIRDIREKAILLPAELKYKVYIIDEVHMLSAGAFNALLKTLEEPPAHVVFILATTEPKKLPATIVGRCQRYDFKRLPANTIAKRLGEVCAAAGIEADDDAISVIAASADGALRDGLSILDQVSSAGERVTKRAVLDALGRADTAGVLELARCLCAYDEKNAMAAMSRLLEDGAECVTLMRELTGMLRDIYAAAYLGAKDGFYFYHEDVAVLDKIGLSVGRAALLDMLETLLSREYQLRQSPQPEIELLSALLRALTPKRSADPDARIDRLEQELERLKATGVTVATPQPVQQVQPVQPSPQPAPPQAKAEAAAKTDTSSPKTQKAPKPAPGAFTEAGWRSVMSELERDDPIMAGPAKTCLFAGEKDGVITLVVPESSAIAAQILNSGQFGDIIYKICEEKYGRGYKVVLSEEKESRAQSGAPDPTALWDDIVVVE